MTYLQIFSIYVLFYINLTLLFPNKGRKEVCGNERERGSVANIFFLFSTSFNTFFF